MRFLSTFLLFGGYMLVYAAVAAGGKFATEPWAGLFADAYTETTDTTVKAQPNEANLPPVPGIPKGAPFTGAGMGHGLTRGVPGGRP